VIRSGIDPNAHAYGATVLVLLTYGSVQGLVGIVMLILVRFRISSGHVSTVRTLEPRIARQWLRYAALSLARSC
jgi:hypothetical protein